MLRYGRAGGSGEIMRQYGPEEQGRGLRSSEGWHGRGEVWQEKKGVSIPMKRRKRSGELKGAARDR